LCSELQVRPEKGQGITYTSSNHHIISENQRPIYVGKINNNSNTKIYRAMIRLNDDGIMYTLIEICEIKEWMHEDQNEQENS